jgi:GNAT superfamily N-acetyltransferase
MGQEIKVNSSDQPRVRAATPEDIPFLAGHHRKMFEEIAEKNNTLPDSRGIQAAGDEYAKKLKSVLGTDSCAAWVIVLGDRIIASGGVSVLSYVPVPHDPQPGIAFLHSIYTEKEYRNCGHAFRITQEATRWCRDQGIRRLYLLASNAGRPVYEKSGFVPVESMMLFLQKTGE